MIPRARVVQIALVPLLLLLVWLWVGRGRLPGPVLAPSRQPMGAASAPPAGRPAAAAPAAALLVLPTRDPFQPPAIATADAAAPGLRNDGGGGAATPLRLQGIVWGVHPPKAIINDRIVTIGESVNGAQVMAIDRDGITVEYQGQRAVLRLPSPSPTRHE